MDDQNELQEGGDDSNLRRENELKKLKLRAEFGARFMEDDEEAAEIPADIESKFLDYVQKFEEAAAKKEVKKVSEVLGNPNFKNQDQLSDVEVLQELDKIFDFMKLHQIELDAIYEVDDREIYRFITEELMEEEIDIIDIPDMMNCFIYEEFHPNHAEDLKRESIDFIEMLLKQDFEFIHYHCADKLIFQGNEIPLDEFIEKAIELLDGQGELILPQIDVGSVNIGAEEASVKCRISLERLNENKPNEKLNIQAVVFHYFDFGFWNLNQIKIPELGFE